MVHRALIRAHGWGNDGLTDGEIERLRPTADQISTTERRSMEAERDTTDRYLAAYLSDRIGTEMTGRISGVLRFGAFVRLDETGADGLIPARAIGNEYFRFDRDSQTLMGEYSGLIIEAGQKVLVRLTEAAPVTGGLIFDLLELDGKDLPAASGRRRGKGPTRRKATRARKKATKVKRKVARKKK